MSSPRLLLALVAACNVSPPAAPPPAAPPPPAPRAPSATATGAPVTPHPAMSPAYPVIAATSCDGRGAAVAAARIALTTDAAGRAVTQTPWGCGCPTGPVFTLAYVPRTSPLEIRLCLDPSKDTCERGCGMPVAWDLAGPMREAGATAVRIAP
ncbi:MAG: hypothetical protein JNK64_04660 [Myxococcales bacterium]|nr:hypothetical protein [Myxococcales bacterium]